MRINTIISGVVIFPGESEKWFTNKNDYIYIKSDGDINVRYNRISTKLTEDMSGLYQCRYGPFTIQNIGKRPVNLQIIKFTCEIRMQKDFFAIDFDQTPFVSVLTNRQPTEVNYSDIIKVLENIQKPQPFQESRDHIDPRLIHLNRYIRKNYKSAITLQELADYVGVHPTYLSNTYSKVFKIPPIYFVNQLRMQDAMDLLVQPDLTINDISTMVGYNSLSQFSSIFKRFYSKSPREYREEALIKNHFH